MNEKTRAASMDILLFRRLDGLCSYFPGITHIRERKDGFSHKRKHKQPQEMLLRESEPMERERWGDLGNE